MLQALNLHDKFARIKLAVQLLTGFCVVMTGAAFAANQNGNNGDSDSKSTHIQTGFDSHVPIPHSTIAVATGPGIVKAMLSCATDRYAHGVLGDTIEAGCIIVEDEFNAVYQLDLPEHQVFEDLIPRIADINGDEHNDVVLVRSDSRKGAALSIYSLNRSNSETILQELATTPPIGTANRWLAPVGIADFNNDGATDVAYIQTPHIGGILKVWSIIDGEFLQLVESRGFSNHSIGDTRVSTAKVADYNDDGVMDMALPDQRRQKTVWITLNPELSVIDSRPYKLDHFD